jgi:serine protein kinase
VAVVVEQVVHIMPHLQMFQVVQVVPVVLMWLVAVVLMEQMGLHPQLDLQGQMQFLKGAAGGYGAEKRVLLLHGPVGSSKSTICRRLKRGLEQYSTTEEGTWYSFSWKNLPSSLYATSTQLSPMFEDPIKLMPLEMRKKVLKDLNQIYSDQSDNENSYTLNCESQLNPFDRFILNDLLEKNDGNWQLVMEEHVEVVRMVHSEIDRIGIGTFQPKDEKNQDSTELTGDLNYRKISQYGSDSDARAFNFDGEFCISNRGMVEFIEALKLAQEFLYDLLGASQEHNVKPKKFPQIYVDELIIAHTNTPEYEKMKDNQFMEALKDRTIKIDVPYLTRLTDEIKIYNENYGPTKVRTHIMPHSLEVVALFAILTRLYDEPDLPLLDKVKLFDGKSLPRWTEDAVKELKDKHPDEGMKRGVSPRYIQDKISNCLAKYSDYVNVFMLLNEIKDGFAKSSSIDKEEAARYEVCLELATKEFEEIIKAEVQKALVADENAIIRLCSKYIDNLVAYVNEDKITNPITGRDEVPDERLMRSIEEKIGVNDKDVDNFRLQISKFIATLHHRGQDFKWDSNPELKKALEAKVFEDIKDHIKLTSFSDESSVVDKGLMEKIDAIKTRLKKFGYNDQSAKDVLSHVSSIYARGDSNK